jgi:hypothetical protein
VATLVATALLLFISLPRGLLTGQDQHRKPLDQRSARTQYSFAINRGGEPFRFQVQIDPPGAVASVSVFRFKDASPFQTVTICPEGVDPWLMEDDAERDLIKHSDLNFDGFEDLQVLTEFASHLGKSVYCIYTWDQRTGRFRYAPEIPSVDPVAHPENKTITVHEDFLFGPYSDRTYRWKRGKVELIEEHGLYYGTTDDPKCRFIYTCSRLVHGKMVTTAGSPFCDDQAVLPNSCPAVTKRSR